MLFILYQITCTEHEPTSKQLFLRLVTLGEGTEDTRRRVLRTELEKLGLHSSMLETVLEEFGQARLLTFDRDPISRTPTIEVAHEALLREWPRLRGWLEQSRDDIRLQRLLAQTAGEWKTAEKDDAYLLRGSRLDQFGAWSEETQLALTQDEKQFLAASLAARVARQEEEESRRKRELQTARQLAETERARADEQAQAAGRLRQRAVWLGGALVIAAVLALAAFFFAQQSDENAETAQLNAQAAATSEAQALNNAELAATNEADAIANLNLATTREAEAIAAEVNALNAQATAQSEADIRATAEAYAREQANLARSRELASVALLNLDDDPERSILLAMEALSQAYTSETESALRQALDISRVRQSLIPPEGFPTSYVTASPDGSSLFVSGPNGATMWDIATGNVVFTRTVVDIYNHPPGTVDEEWITRASFNPDGSLLVIPNEQWVDDNPVTGTITILDTNSYEELITFPAHDGQVQIVKFNQEGTQFATGGLDTMVKIWDVQATLSNGVGQEVATLCCHDDWIWSVAFSPDGTRLITDSNDKTLIMWDIESGEQLFTIEVDTRDVVFSPDGQYIIFGTRGDGDIMVYDSEQGTLHSQIVGAHGLTIEQITFSPDGTRIGTASQDRTAKIWEYENGQVNPDP